MALQTLKQLLGTRTLDQVRASISNAITARAVSNPDVNIITEWVAGGALKTLFEVDADSFYLLEGLIPVLAASGFVDLATGEWLDYLAASQYNLERAGSVFAVDQVVLTAQAGSGPHVIGLNQLWAITANGLRFNTVQAGTLPAGGTLALQVIAEHPGAAYNTPRGAINQLLTPLSGVTVSNSVSSGLVVAGADTESDARLRLRCKLRWSELAASPTRDTFKAWVLKASPSVTKVTVQDNNPRGPGTLNVIVWGAGGIGSSDCTDDRVQPSTTNIPPYYPGTFTPGAINTYLQARRGIGANLQAYPATETLISIQATITILPGYQATVQPRIVANLKALENSLDIGGLLYRNNIIDALLENTLGTVSVNLISPAADVQLSPGHVGTLVPALTFVS